MNIGFRTGIGNPHTVENQHFRADFQLRFRRY